MQQRQHLSSCYLPYLGEKRKAPEASPEQRSGWASTGKEVHRRGTDWGKAEGCLKAMAQDPLESDWQGTRLELTETGHVIRIVCSQQKRGAWVLMLLKLAEHGKYLETLLKLILIQQVQDIASDSAFYPGEDAGPATLSEVRVSSKCQKRESWALEVLEQTFNHRAYYTLGEILPAAVQIQDCLCRFPGSKSI